MLRSLGFQRLIKFQPKVRNEQINFSDFSRESYVPQKNLRKSVQSDKKQEIRQGRPVLLVKSLAIRYIMSTGKWLRLLLRTAEQRHVQGKAVPVILSDCWPLKMEALRSYETSEVTTFVRNVRYFLLVDSAWCSRRPESSAIP